VTAEPASAWFERYAELRPLYDAFTERLLSFVELLAADEGIALWHSYAWAFSDADFEQLVKRERRRGRTIDDPFNALGDFAGAALVVRALGEVDELAAVVERELAVDYAASRPPAAAREEVERARTSGEPRMDYSHVYYTVQLPERRRTLAEWSAYADLRAEVHVLTVIQYAWWCLDTTHLPYHWESSYPPAAREAFARVARLLEEADLALVEEERTRPELDAAYDDAVARSEDVPLDVRGVAAYLRGSDTLGELAAVAEAEGMRRDEESDVEPADSVLEQETLWLLKRNGITTIAELDAFVRGALPRARTILRDICRVSSDHGFVPYATRESVLAFLVLVLHRGDTAQVELIDYHDALTHALDTVIGNPPRADMGGTGS